MMGYISHELQQPLANLTEHMDNTRDFLRTFETAAGPGPVPSEPDLMVSSLNNAAAQVTMLLLVSSLSTVKSTVLQSA